MKNKNQLVAGQTYEIRYRGPEKYNDYSGMGVYTGESTDIDGPVFGFTLPNSSDVCFFPLEDIFSATDETETPEQKAAKAIELIGNFRHALLQDFNNKTRRHFVRIDEQEAAEEELRVARLELFKALI